MATLDEIYGTSSGASGKSLDEIYGTKPAANPLVDFGHAALSVAGKQAKLADAAQKRILSTAQWAADSPVAHGLDAILNVGSRVGTAAVAGRNPFKAVIDPASATDLTHGAERNVLHNSTLQIPDIPPEAWKNPWTGTMLRFGQVVLDLAFETGLDPTMMIPGYDLWSLAKKLGRAGEAAAKIGAQIPGVAKAGKWTEPARAGAANLIDRAKGAVVEGHDLRKGVKRPGEDVTKGVEISGKDAVTHEEQRYADLVERHRPVLEAIDEQRKGIRARLAEMTPLADQGYEKAKGEVNALRAAYDETTARVPQEIKDAYNRRAYLEGTPEVRRKVMARGFKPTKEEAAQPVINRLHGLNDEYEPTQKIFAKEDLEWSGAPIQYRRQGNRQATWDMRKTGGEPDAPLADRILDRLVSGARITNDYASRKKILSATGLLPIGESASERMRAAIWSAHAAGDTAKAERLQRAYDRQLASQETSAATRAEHLQPGTHEEAQQKIEILDPRLAKKRVFDDMKRSGELPESAKLDPKTGEVTYLIKPDSTPRDTRYLKGTITGGRRALIDAEQFQQLAEAAARRTAGAVDRSVRPGQASAQNLVNSAIRTKAETAHRIEPLFPKPPSGILDPEGRPINVPHTEMPFNDRKVGMPEAPPPPGPLVGGRPKPRTPAQVRDLLHPPLGKPPSLEPPHGPVPPILDAAGNAIRKPTAAERTQERILRPVGNLTEQIKRNAGRQPSAANLVGPSQTAALGAAQRTGKVEQRLIGRTERLASETERNNAIKELQKRADAMTDETNLVKMPAALQRRLYGDREVYRKGVMYALSELQRDALFIIPWAHMKNITVLALMGPNGARVVSAGQGYVKRLKDDPAGLADRVRGLEEIGASSHYIGRATPTYAQIPKVGEKLGDIAEHSNAVLERYDMAMRMALEDELKSRGITGWKAGGQIRDVLGDYTNQAPAIRELRNRLGANFPAWGLGIVPRAMTKALRESPKAMKTYARLERLLSDDVTQPMFGTDFSAGGPVEGMAGMMFPHPGPQNFYTSQARLGVPGAALALAGAARAGKPAQEVAAETMRLIPGGTMLSAASGFPYPSGAPWPLRTAASAIGAYFPRHHTVKQRANQLRQLGIKNPELHRILQSEGYYPQAAPLPSQGKSLDDIFGGSSPAAASQPSRSLDDIFSASQP